MIAFTSLIESSIGIMASSFPSLRRFYRRLLKKDVGDDGGLTPNTDDIITFGASGPSKDGMGRGPRSSRNKFHNPTDMGISLTTVQGRSHKDKWERLNDGDSDKSNLLRMESVKGIRAQYTYTVEIEEDTDGSTGTRSDSRAPKRS